MRHTIIPEADLFNASKDELFNAIKNWVSYPPRSLVIIYLILERSKIPMDEISSEIDEINRSSGKGIEANINKFWNEWGVSSIEEYKEKLDAGTLVKVTNKKDKFQAEDKNSRIVRNMIISLLISWIFLILFSVYVAYNEMINSVGVIILWLICNSFINYCLIIIKNQEKIMSRLDKMDKHLRQ